MNHPRAFDQHIPSVSKCFLKQRILITCHNIIAAVLISDDNSTCLKISRVHIPHSMVESSGCCCNYPKYSATTKQLRPDFHRCSLFTLSHQRKNVSFSYMDHHRRKTLKKQVRRGNTQSSPLGCRGGWVTCSTPCLALLCAGFKSRD